MFSVLDIHIEQYGFGPGQWLCVLLGLLSHKEILAHVYKYVQDKVMLKGSTVQKKKQTTMLHQGWNWAI